MKKLLNKIGMFLTKKLHLLSVVCNFKKTVELSDNQLTKESIQMLHETLIDLKECNKTADRIINGLEDYHMKLIEGDFNNKINYN